MILAPGTVEVLAAKKAARYLVLEAEPGFDPPTWETRDLFGVRFDQEAAQTPITAAVVRAGTTAQLPDSAVRDLMPIGRPSPKRLLETSGGHG